MRILSPPDKKQKKSAKTASKLHLGTAARGRAKGRSLRKLQPKELPRSEHSRLYKQLSPAYEILFPLVSRKRIMDAIAELNLATGSQVLEVGVGTGVSLKAYPHDINVVGIDLSTDMLAIAERKIKQEGWDHIRVQPGNAEELEFPDASFDCVTSFHTVSVVSRPEQMMQEIIRVVRPGGRILIINHFRSPRPWLANMIDRADPVTRHLGWRTDLAIDSIVRSLPIQVERCYKTSPWSLFTVMTATRL